ncbi:bifunctional phosphopantothenoylcysteine decarboxylase/phosphopantothenate--cysteine ligase CoaBC [Pengzhenrongella frigida]|uniref:Coenzyme A biosynthesis bifunctional protein CoaBC n=1 Tax=Pengzhenrongella frigida TaxID=1259133 RepID=A0A4Q5N3R6_9MICO|nr:bifunctional phosphopantothenoylcysteine decarboxylase/phosphopantothenate--cysteine ligase CoaBC [Cellulomonas sp. HLT2-17]RYV52889.1 bifunctional phosphopantothenoylcysteine decarboxylase/phosphopantothenate--cysteine ligase CoaBC [Cellulomonas sp. HLT2-17]
MQIVLGVAGGIAAYKAVLLLRLLREAGHDVRVVPTRAALEFVGRPTWEALSGQSATPEVFDDVAHVPHVALGQHADLVIVAPATADLLARAAAGRADDLLTSTLLTARCPVLMAPAMHTEMWDHPATRANVATLRARGVHVLDPASGRLTGADTGPGRLPEPDQIAAAALALVAPPRPQDLAGRHVVISAGGTREPLDPVRYLGNRSSGRQGYALARTARDRGARVTVVAANVSLDDPAGVDVVEVETTDQLRTAVRAAARTADVVVMAAAVADFRPVAAAGHKVKKRSDGVVDPILLEANPDILAELTAERLRPGQVIVGFAAETGDEHTTVLEYGRAKARRKGADLLAVNAVGHGLAFGTTDNAVTILDRHGDVLGAAVGSKDEVADALWDEVCRLG